MNSSPEKNEECVSCEFQDNLAVLRELVFFGGISLDCLKVLAIMADTEVFRPGDALLRQGEDNARAIYIMRGTARLYREEDGEEEGLTEYGAGAFIGGLSLMGNSPSLFSLRASDTVTGLLITREKFESAMAQFQDQMPKLFRNAADIINNWEKRLLADRSPQCEACRRNLGVSLV